MGSREREMRTMLHLLGLKRIPQVFPHSCSVSRSLCISTWSSRNSTPHKKPISLLNVPICTQGMQRTWWPEAGTIIVTAPYCKLLINTGTMVYTSPQSAVVQIHSCNGILLLVEWCSVNVSGCINHSACVNKELAIRSSDNDSTSFWPPGSLHTLGADGHI